MDEQKRQLWIGIAMDLMVAYYDAQDFVCSELNNADHPDVFIREMCQRVADAVNADANDDATADFVYEIVQRRLKEPR